MLQLPAPDFEVLNAPADFEKPEDVTEYFSLTALSNTRLGRRAAIDDEVTAPMVLKRLRHPFVLCEATVSVDFQVDWDQAGLVIFAGSHPGRSDVAQLSRSLRISHAPASSISYRNTSKWARIALELIAGEVNISTLVANPKCGVDWASTPAWPFYHPSQLEETSMPSIRLKFEKIGLDLWIWFMVPDLESTFGGTPSPESVRRQWRKCREVVNFFDPMLVKGGLWIGCYASRPTEVEVTNNGIPENGLFAEFEDLEIL